MVISTKVLISPDMPNVICLTFDQSGHPITKRGILACEPAQLPSGSPVVSSVLESKIGQPSVVVKLQRLDRNPSGYNEPHTSEDSQSGDLVRPAKRTKCLPSCLFGAKKGKPSCTFDMFTYNTTDAERITDAPSRWKVLDLIGGVPARVMPKEGYRKWGEDPMDQPRVKRNAEELILLGAPCASAHLSLYRAFTKWRTTNTPHTTLAETLVLFAGYLDGTGLKKSTCGQYVRTAKAMSIHAGEKMGDPSGVVEKVLKGLDLKAALEPPEHAVDITETRLAEILATLEKDEIRFYIWLMAYCGARARDIQRLHSIQLRLEGSRLTILYRVTKTNREPGCAHQITYEVRAFEEQWRPFMERPKICRLDSDKQKLCDVINKTLHSAGFEETTYSFRRFFVQSTIDRFTKEDHTEWCRVIELTDHKTEKRVKGHYQHHIDDQKPDAHVSKAKVGRKVPVDKTEVTKQPKLVQLSLLKMLAR